MEAVSRLSVVNAQRYKIDMHDPLGYLNFFIPANMYKQKRYSTIYHLYKNI